MGTQHEQLLRMDCAQNACLTASCGTFISTYTLHCCISSFQTNGIFSRDYSSPACGSHSCTHGLAGGSQDLTLVTMTDIPVRLRQRWAG